MLICKLGATKLFPCCEPDSIRKLPWKPKTEKWKCTSLWTRDHFKKGTCPNMRTPSLPVRRTPRRSYRLRYEQSVQIFLLFYLELSSWLPLWRNYLSKVYVPRRQQACALQMLTGF